MRSGLSTRSGSEAGSALNGAKSGASTEPQWYSSNGVCGVGVGHLDRAVEPEVPLAVGEVEHHGVGGGHASGDGRG